MPDCNSCHEPFADFGELAKHIIENQSTHPKSSVIWARNFTLKHAIFAKKMPERTPYTEQDRLNREACLRNDISGRLKIATTFCVNCRQSQRQPIPIELDNPMVWRVKDMIVVTCEYCSRINRRF